MEEYWTPERMRNAIPLTPEDTGAKRSSGTAEQPSGPPGSTPAAAPSGEIRTKIVETSVAGKVFFTKPSDGKNYVCSASALNSNSKQMAIAAGHCVHEGNGGNWMKNWMYVPQYRNGDKPYGTFVAKQMRTFNGWINDGDLNWDVAMVTTWPQGSDKLVHRTGGNGLSWNYSWEQDSTINGYPGNKDNGEVRWYCEGRTSDSGGEPALGCDFGGGSSGSPADARVRPVLGTGPDQRGHEHRRLRRREPEFLLRRQRQADVRRPGLRHLTSSGSVFTPPHSQ